MIKRKKDYKNHQAILKKHQIELVETKMVIIKIF